MASVITKQPTGSNFNIPENVDQDKNNIVENGPDLTEKEVGEQLSKVNEEKMQLPEKENDEIKRLKEELEERERSQERYETIDCCCIVADDADVFCLTHCISSCFRSLYLCTENCFEGCANCINDCCSNENTVVDDASAHNGCCNCGDCDCGDCDCGDCDCGDCDCGDCVDCCLCCTGLLECCKD